MNRVIAIISFWAITSFSSSLIASSENTSTHNGENTTMSKPDILTQAPIIPPGVVPDEVNLSDTVNLEDLVIQYTYSSGRAYKLRFYDDRVSFTQLDTQNVPTLTVPYRARKIIDDMYLVHWLVPGRIGHVTLVLDLKNERIQASALMPGQMELFDDGDIIELQHGKYTK